MEFLEKIKISLAKPKVIIISGSNKGDVRALIEKILSSYFKIGKDVLIRETGPEEINELGFLIKKSSLPILVAENTEKQLADSFPKGFLVLLLDKTVKILDIGLGKESELEASDININGGINFKINYKGNIVPVWLDSASDKGQIPGILAAVAVGVVFGLNLVEISQALKNPANLIK